MKRPQLDEWRARALEYLPEFRSLIEEQTGPTDLWIELSHQLVKEYDRQPIDEERIGRVYDYAAWCAVEPDTGDPERDPSRAVAVGFLEDLPLNRRVADDLHRWISAEAFAGCEALFRCALSEQEYQRFAANFRRKRKQFSGPARL